MNYKKDNSNKYNRSDSHISGIASYKQGVNDSKVFSKRHIEFMSKRLEKLSSAIYIVTDLVSDSEPLKWKLRQTSLSLLSDTSGYKLNISENIYKIVSFLDIALVGNIISEMNASVLKHEFESLIKVMDNIKKEDLVGSLFMYEKNEIGIIENDGNNSNHNKGHADVDVLYKTNKDHTVDNDKQNPKGHKGLPFVERSFVSTKSKSKNDKHERRSIILGTVRKKKEVSVKDISILISDCSEKTIQRELISMVKDKILNKKGEKRWSRYSLWKSD
jgi:hypothetical protein